MMFRPNLARWSRKFRSRCRRYAHIRVGAPEMKERFDVVVVGGGHAGCEGAAAAARCGARTLLITHKVDTIGVMSCNPSFGGIGKGHLLRELDAFDGVAPRICDQSAITYQALNRKHGPAVIGLRAQIDRSRFQKLMKDEIVNKTPNLLVVEASVEDLLLNDDENVDGCTLSDGTVVRSNAVLITTGTFLGAEIFQGTNSVPAGRIGDPASNALSKTFSRLGFELGRLRTGTPPRLNAKTIDFAKFEVAKPDDEPIPFSFLTDKVWIDVGQQRPTYFGYTNSETAKIIHDNLHLNRYFIGEVKGPRYCPSLESKVTRFPKLNHRLFLEHEGLDSDVIYAQGMSMTFSTDVQEKIMRSIKGLEVVEILQPGYGVVYDFVNPKQIDSTLETRKVRGLFLAGQINGTTGYEEAAAQGVVAGINAAWRSNKLKCDSDLPVKPLTICRTEGYTGVMLDDLTNFGAQEPYRMFTSRVEFRLHLRPDNADMRLTELGRQYGAVSDSRWRKFRKTKDAFHRLRNTLQGVEMSLLRWGKLLNTEHTRLPEFAKVLNAYEVLHRHQVPLKTIFNALPQELAGISDLIDDSDLEQRILLDGRYSIQHKLLVKQMHEMRQDMQAELPEDLDYADVTAINMECREKLDVLRPRNLAAASRIEGITPEALISLLRYVKKQEAVSR